MINVTFTPLISLSAFIIGFVVVGVLARIVAEVYIARTDKASASLERQAGARHTANDAVQRFYNTYDKRRGA